MANKTLFSPASKAPPAFHRNEAGGSAYAFSAEHALAQYAVTGTFNRTYYATEGEQLDLVLSLLSQLDSEFIAKTAVYARERGRMKDMPALLLAYLAVADVKLLARVFARVIDNGKMLRTFVQIVRSGVVGRKSFGSAPKRLIRSWFASRTPSELFRQSLGTSPSFRDVIKMVRPSPKSTKGELDQEREALYGYLIGKKVAFERLPAEVQSYEAFKRHGGELPNVPFEMLTALGLRVEHWADLAQRMSFNQLRQGLNTLLRHGVFRDPAMVELVASRLRDPERVKRSGTLPYQLLSAFTATASTMPGAITLALQEAMETAIVNVPRVSGKIYVCPDVSGSMHSAVTGERKGATSTVRCLDVAALVAAAILRRNPSAEVIPFSDDVVLASPPLNPFDSVMTNSRLLSQLPSGGTACSAPLRYLNARKASGDLVIYVSDNQSWADFMKLGPTAMAVEWERFWARNRSAKLVLIDLQPNPTTQVRERTDVLNVGGFSDAVFDLIALFEKGELDPEHFVGTIKSVDIA